MYKWHVHSVVGRGRPQIGDLSKVTDGIAASLRLFHVSVSAAAEDGGNRRAPQGTRAQRSATAAAEISSLSAGGIDARSLAAAPPPSFRIRRVDASPIAIPRPAGVSRGTYRGRGMGMRGDFGSSGGRGGMRGQRGRGRGGRGGDARKKRSTGMPKAGDLQYAPLTPEEQAYVDSVEMGVQMPAELELMDSESLGRQAPGMPILSAPFGMVNTIHEHYRAFAGEFGHDRLSPAEHAEHYRNGATLFVDDEDMARANEKHPGMYESLEEQDRESILQRLVAGHSEPLRPVLNGDTIGTVDRFSQRNETYLPKDAAILRERIQRMLPSKNAPKPATPAARR